VSVKDELEPVCTGTHARFIVDVAKTAERRAAKLARWEAMKK
jgi:hypothetical protein